MQGPALCRFLWCGANARSALSLVHARGSFVLAQVSLVLALGLLPSCTCEPSPAPATLSEQAPPEKEPQAPPQEEPTLEEEPPEAPADTGSQELAQETLWRLGELADLGPAGPTLATAQGVYFVSLDNHVFLAKRQGDTWLPLDEPASRFALFGRSPARTPTHLYWINQQGQLLRSSLKKLTHVEVLAHSAYPGSRVSALSVRGRDLVAFLSADQERPRATLWYEGTQNTALASVDASTASSVQLVSGSPHPRLFILEGRSGMSPLHVRSVQLSASALSLGEDQVIWVGPGANSFTEIQALARPKNETSLFLAASREVTEFGLAHLSLTNDSQLRTAPLWQIYPNGIDPAPVTSASLCGRDYVLYVQPSEAAPRSPQELRIAQLGAGPPASTEILARSRAFNDVSIASRPGGAVLSWTADRRTWGLLLHCPTN